MKFSAAFTLALCAGASAFTSPSAPQNQRALRMADAVEEASPVAATPEAAPATPPLPAMSQALPFLPRPAALDGSLVGDVGFDPLGFAKTRKDLLNNREAEVKHARLAMLAAAGWPLSELLDRKLAAWSSLPALVDASDRAPSLLNGGLGKVSPVYWAVCLAAAAAIDIYGFSRTSGGNALYFGGNLGFDPLGLYPKDEAGQKRMQLAELKNGRLAMIAITAFAFQEFVSKVGVVDETPLFFKPLGQAMHEAANAGYYIPN